ncbi:MAG: M56 family metallopeptidase [Terracidiphilus sp.]
MIPSLVEIAVRALLVAAAVWAGLRVMRVRDVLAQKTAWGLVLAAAVLMPLLLPLALRWQVLPANMTLAVPAQPLRMIANTVPPASKTRQSADSAHDSASVPLTNSSSTAKTPEPAFIVPVIAAEDSASISSGARSTIQTPPPLAPRDLAPAGESLLPTLQTLAWTVYMAVCGVLLLRLIYGLTSAISLWLDAEPIAVAHAANLRLRTSRAVSSPVTIGSGVVLPADYVDWESEKLRIVLAHERSHIRQGDFYLQLLAGLYSALFWFSPLGWWLKRQLSDLGEAISDRAGLEEAASRSSYAQILLEFAGMPRPTLIGVAMARTSSLSHRIERLLNDSSFRQAFSWSRSRALAAVLLVPVALFAATAMVRVQTAQAAARQTPAIVPAQAESPASGVSHPDETQVDEAPAAAIAPVAPIAPVSPVVPPVPVGTGVMAIPPGAPAAPQATPPPPPPADDNVTVGAGQSMTIMNGRRGPLYLRSGNGQGFAFSFRSDDDEDSYALVTEPRGGVRFSGDWMDGRREEIDRASRTAKGGKFLWFSHDGKSYVIDDAAIVASIEAMYKPIDDLGRQQEELGKQQEELGRQQEELGRKQEQASVPAPDVSREIAAIKEALAKLESKEGGAVTQDDLSDLQGKIGDLQGRLGDIQGRIGDIQGKLGEEQGKLGEKQGELGEQQGRLGEEQGRLAQEADRKVRSIIDDSLKNGKARPVE